MTVESESGKPSTQGCHMTVSPYFVQRFELLSLSLLVLPRASFQRLSRLCEFQASASVSWQQALGSSESSQGFGVSKAFRVQTTNT